MKTEMVCRRKILQVFSVYPLQQYKPKEETRKILEKLSDNIHDVPRENLLRVAGGMNCHNGSTREGIEDVIRYFSYPVRNQEGEKHAETVSRA